MTDFATDLIWEEEKQPILPAPLRDRLQDKNVNGSAPSAPVESQSERLQRVAGNAALAREAEEAEAARKKLTAAASPAGRDEAAEKQLAETAVTAQAERLSEATKAAAARAAALTQVLASFEKNAGNADLVTLARLIETAPPGVGEETARVIALVVMRAEPAQRSAIAARIATELGDRRDMRLAPLLADRLAWLTVTTAKPAPAPP